MKLFRCSHCGQFIYFENNRCVQCGYALGFETELLELLPLVPEGEGAYVLFGAGGGVRYRYCANEVYGVCNWLVPADSGEQFCRACTLNRTIPNLSDPEYRVRWRSIETAKHRLVYSLLRLGLPLVSKGEDAAQGLSFDFVADGGADQKVLTGHLNGLITINIAEANDIEREMARKAMDEVYRTVLGHFRHEVGHYYWDRLIASGPQLEPFRRLFGDERQDYGAALNRHYQKGPQADWNQQFISAYAGAHPWEDWAETWAHYLHIIDTLETAYSFGLSVRPALGDEAGVLCADIKADPYQVESFAEILQLWLPLTFAMNSMNRSMGLNDLYPFVISARVVEKLAFIHQVCHVAGGVNRLMEPKTIKA
ncbi:putative zinc-binding peptidase [Paraflavisolibacter sp. H34]|uniref:zinc-binding metallopeptidase family protein n=1 Tax=Huijunlia imazamoxiresistens TaxID=3127457 RepID=UPI0030190CA5